VHNELGGAKKLIANRRSESDNQSMTSCYIRVRLLNSKVSQADTRVLSSTQLYSSLFSFQFQPVKENLQIIFGHSQSKFIIL